MRIRNKTAAFFAGLLLTTFIPVFYSILFIGNEMDYNAQHKIETLWGNRVLFLLGLGGVLLFIALYTVFDKVPLNRYTTIGMILFCFIFCVVFYAIKVEISKCIAFYGGWDCGMVANSARWLTEGKDIGYEDYYYIYSNNIPITWLLYVLYRFASTLTGYVYNPEFIWIQYQCAMFSLAVFFAALTAFVIYRKIAPTLLCLFVSAVTVGLCPWQMVPYSDGASIAIPVLTLFLYALYRQLKRKGKYAVWFLMAYVGSIGGNLKATCYVALIAVVLTEFFWALSEKECVVKKLKQMAVCGFLLLCAFMTALWCRNGMYRAVGYVPDYDLQMTWSNYLYMGLNESSTGASSSEGYDLARAYAGCPGEIRRSAELQYIGERIREKGVKGLLDFWLRKQVMNFNDGTFSWFQEGWFYAWDYQELTSSAFREPLRAFYWKDGVNYVKFTTWSQGIWIFILTGILLEAVFVIVSACRTKEDREMFCMDTAFILAFCGMFLFVLLFEGRARYLLNYLPVFSVMATLGCVKAAQAVRILRLRRGKDKRQ